MHCLNSTSENSEMRVLEWQSSGLKWQQEHLGQQPPLTYINENDQFCFLGLNSDQGLRELVVNGAMKPDPGIENGWNDDFRRLLSYGNDSEFETISSLPRTASCPPASIGKEAALISSATVKDSCKKRKADKIQSIKVSASEEKRMKGCATEESKATEQNSNSKSTTTTVSTSTNKNSKGPSAKAKQSSEAPKTDYIHVRARRGQATDSHSLAERVRREKISERMKFLQDLVPGCNKVTGKAGMLDEIINYVQSLQKQVEFLSMKLAAINPRLDFDIENCLVKEIFPVQTMGASSSGLVNPGELQFITSAREVSGSGLEMVVDPMDGTLRRTISAPVSVPQTFMDPASLNQITWEDELQNLYSMEYQQGRSTSFISHPITGFLDASHVKLEM